MPLLLGDTFPNFSAESSEGSIDSFHNWLGNSWAILFSHPSDFTPVCTTELARASQLSQEFSKRNVKLVGLSCDSIGSHKEWARDICAYISPNCGNESLPFPLIADPERKLAHLLGMLDPDELDSSGVPLTARSVFIIDPQKRMRLSILYPATTGRNFDEILRVVDSLLLTTAMKVATPENWKIGDEAMALPTLTNQETCELFGSDNVRTISLPSGKSYLRFIKFIAGQ